MQADFLTLTQLHYPRVQMYNFLALLAKQASAENFECCLNSPRVVSLASQALVETFTIKNCLLGLRKTGMSPVDRHSFFSHPSIQDSDRLYCASREVQGGLIPQLLRGPLNLKASGHINSDQVASNLCCVKL